MRKSNLQRLTRLSSGLNLFNGAAQSPQAPQPSATPAPAPPTPAPAPFDANDPAVAHAMSIAREQERSQRIEELSGLKSQLEQLKAERKAEKEAAEQAARAAELEEMKPQAREIAKVNDSLASLQQKLQEMQAKHVEATNQANAWQIEAEKAKLVAELNGEIDPLALDTSSVAALRASVPQARQAYEATRQHFFARFQQEYDAAKQTQVEGLPGYPPGHGFPTPNAAGAVVQNPQMHQGVSPQQQQSFAHPQVDGGQSYAQMRSHMHGVVQQAMPPAQGNYFAPTYPQQQQPGPVQHPQGYPTGPAVSPNMYQPQPGAYQPPVGQPLQVQQPMAGGQMPSQALAMQQQAQTAPLPDPGLRAENGHGRALTQVETAAARQQAAAKIAQTRLRAGNIQGSAVDRVVAHEAKHGAQPIQLVGQPIGGPGMQMNGDVNGATHPMTRTTPV